MTHGMAGYRSGCRCAECTSANTQTGRAYRARRRAAGRPVDFVASRPRVDANCEGCGKTFSARFYPERGGHSATCSRRCANVVRNMPRRKAKPPRKSAFRKRSEREAAKAAAGTSGRTVFAQGPCTVCGEAFTARRFNDLPRYCSEACKQRANRAWIDYSTRYAIYARDDWTCQLCRQKTHRWTGEYDPLSATLDHIIPRSKGGSDDWSNLRLLCARCNSLRGDLTYLTDADLAA